jgi:hypothetical protein
MVVGACGNSHTRVYIFLSASMREHKTRIFALTRSIFFYVDILADKKVCDIKKYRPGLSRSILFIHEYAAHTRV